MEHNGDNSEYRGLRALLLTRVSTPEQAKKYSHDAQERKVRELIIDRLGLILDERRHIIHDTYSGLEYRYREALERILEMAQRGEFDVLCMDVLDRGLGRKALARELYRMQLRELGIQILTTDPSDHADDDTLVGQVIRFFKGYKAEEEVNDFVRRTMDGRREKALGNVEKNKPQRIIGSGHRLYGYKFIRTEKGVIIEYELNHEIIYVEEDGTEWTEVKVIVFIFESAASGVSVRSIAGILNAKGIPTPYTTKNKRVKGMKEVAIWQHDTVRRVLSNTAYYGEYRHFRTAKGERKPGQKRIVRRKTSEEEQIIVAIPAIVTKDLFEKAKRRVAQNKSLATRNNKTSTESLLRGGFAKCAYCGCALTIKWNYYTPPSTGEEMAYFYYGCRRPYLKGDQKCPGCTIAVESLDAAVKEYIFETIRDPREVDEKIRKLQEKNPAQKQQQQKLKNLNAILQEQENYRRNLSSEMKKKIMSERTIAHLNAEITLLEQQEQDARRDLADTQKMQEKEEQMQKRIAEFHQKCQEWREKLDDPQFTPSFKFLQDAVLFFGISVTVWRSGTKPPYVIHTDPPEIMELLSSMTLRP